MTRILVEGQRQRQLGRRTARHNRRLAILRSDHGAVNDGGGATLPGATVTVRSDSREYNIPCMKPGAYKVTVTLVGFKTAVRDAKRQDFTGERRDRRNRDRHRQVASRADSYEFNVVSLASTMRWSLMNHIFFRRTTSRLTNLTQRPVGPIQNALHVVQTLAEIGRFQHA